MKSGEFNIKLILNVTLIKYEGALLQQPKKWGYWLLTLIPSFDTHNFLCAMLC